MTINQGFVKKLNLRETINDSVALDNLGGVGISNDLAIIQNNLRNTSTASYQFLIDGYFTIDSEIDFSFTDDDVVTVDKDINVGITTIFAGVDYYVCNNVEENKFKLSTTSSSTGISTIIVSQVVPDDFTFIRKDPVYQENLINFIKPEIPDDTQISFAYFGGDPINSTFKSIELSQGSAEFEINNIKYKTNKDTLSDKDINVEGSIIIEDPVQFNATGINSVRSPGLFIGEIRAFSQLNNPWTTQVGTGLSTLSTEASVEEIYFGNNIRISGIGTANLVGITFINLGGSNPYQIAENPSWIPTLTDGRTLNDNLTTLWNGIDVVQTSTGYDLLLQGSPGSARDGEWFVYFTNSTGLVTGNSGWQTTAQASLLEVFTKFPNFPQATVPQPHTSVKVFTHKLPITINGETYYLLLRA
jgi:hypothetical protein